MTEAILFLLIFITPAALFLILLRFSPVWSARLAVWGSVALALLMEGQLASIFPRLATTDTAFLLRAGMLVVGTLAVLGGLLCSRIRAWRRHCTRHTLYLLFAGAFSLLFIQYALAMGEILPGLRYLLPFHIKVSTASFLLFALLIFWQLGLCSLAAHLDATPRKLVRRSPAAPSAGD